MGDDAPAFWAACEQRGWHYPPFVQRQLSSFARCGDPAHGFSLYASPSVAACATASRERLARYIARSPIAESRLSVMAVGYILLRLKRRFRNGIHSVACIPSPLSSASAPCCPAHDATSLRITGSLPQAHSAARALSQNRRLALAKVIHPLAAKQCRGARRSRTRPAHPAKSKKPGARSRPYIHWPNLMRRCFDIDVLLCPHCLGRRRIIALLEDPLVVHQILNRPEIPGRALKTSPVAATATSTPSPLPDKCRANLAGPIRPRHAPAPTTGSGPKSWRSRYVALRRWTS
jgi:hypothetical protein